MDKNWKDKDTIRFLKLYQKEKCLWNYKHENYRNQSTRKASVLNILKAMNKPGLTESEVRNKIRNIRSTYAQELTKFIRALKENRKDYMSSLAWFPIAHNFLRKVVASKSLEKNTDSSFIGTSETCVTEADAAKVKKPPMVGDSPNSDENSENSDDSRKMDSPFDSPGSPGDTITEEIETSHVEDPQVEVASAPFNPQNFHNTANVKIEASNSDNSQAGATQNVFYLQDILDAANSKTEIPNNVNYQIVDAQNIFYLQDSLNSARQLVDIAKCNNVQVLQMQSPVNLHNSSTSARNIKIPKSSNVQVLQMKSGVGLLNSPNPASNIEIPKSSKVQVLQLQQPVNLKNTLNPRKNIKVSKSNNMKVIQIQRPVSWQNSPKAVARKMVKVPNSNNIELQSPNYLQNSIRIEKRKEVDTPNSYNMKAVEVQNPVSLQKSVVSAKLKRKRKSKVLNTVQVQEPTNPEDLIEDEFFHFSQNVAHQLRTLPLKSALLCQAKILEIITKERVDAAQKISTAPMLQPLTVQHPDRSKKLSNVNYDQWETDCSTD